MPVVSKITAPDYAAAEYWDAKYLQNPRPFEWLVPSHTLEDEISSALKQFRHSNPKILHIGPGTSSLSFALRRLASDPADVYNLDYSAIAVQWGVKTEAHIIKTESQQALAQEPTTTTLPAKHANKMNWIQASLLSLDSLVSSCTPHSFSLVVDKGTADSVACGDEVLAETACPLVLAGSSQVTSTAQSPPLNPLDARLDTYYLQPTYLLALHLAYLTAPGGLWLCLSYSENRFRFLEPELDRNTDDDALPAAVVHRGYPDGHRLWTVEKSLGLETSEDHMDDGRVVHRPKAMHYFSVLRRTNEKLLLRDSLLPFSRKS